MAQICRVIDSSVTDLTLSGDSWWSRAVDDSYLTNPQAAELVRSYLNGHSLEAPSPLYADLKGLAPIRVHVGSACFPAVGHGE